MKKYFILFIFFLIALFSIHNVYALELTHDSKFLRSDTYGITSGNNWTSQGIFMKRSIGSHTTANIQELTLVYPNNNKDYSKVEYVEIPFVFSQPLTDIEYFSNSADITLTDDLAVLCDEWTLSSSSSPQSYHCTSWSGYNFEGTVDDYNIVFKNTSASSFNFYFQLQYSDDDYEQCSISGGNIICPTKHKRPATLWLYYTLRSTSDYYTSLDVFISKKMNLYTSSSSSIIDSIEEQTDQENANTDKQIESQKVCKKLIFNSNSDYSSFTNNYYIGNNGTIYQSSGFRLSPFFEDVTKIIRSESWSNLNVNRICFFNESKTLISCNDSQTNGEITIPANTKFLRFNQYASTNTPNFVLEFCKNGNQAVNDSINNVNDTLNNSNTTGANSSAGGFFNDFTDNDFGLSAIITKPLQFINGLSSGVCYDLSLPMPFVNQNVTLPCMLPIYQTYFGSFLTLYQTITTGFIAYWVCVNIFRMVKGFKNPESDQVEVMDL